MSQVTTNIDYLNDLMEVCIEHGGDSGGPYLSCPDKVVDVLNKMACNSGFVFAVDYLGRPKILRLARVDETYGEARGIMTRKEEKNK